jgi:hypothetical protein
VTLQYGVPRREFEGLSRIDLEDAASNAGISAEGTDEQIIDRLVEAHYPIYPLPKYVDPDSPRGVVFSAVLDEGVPRESASVSAMVNRMVEIGVPDQSTARQMINQQIDNLVRMYGYTVIVNDGETVRLAQR